MDTNGHGTHVAGIIAGDGAKSTTVTNAPGSTLPGGTGTNYEFRGMAPGATLYSVGGIFGGADTNVISDYYFQTVPALTNALISNNSWVYEGDSVYDLAAASYDAATRDALPFVTGSQPVLFVFAAGNAGNGSDSEDLGGGVADSIESPATAKDVITVGAIQEDRNISVTVTNADGSPNTSWADETSTRYRVAGFSSRGNVGVGIEGAVGRYKPDVCAPGTFTLSTRSEQWDIGTYFYQNPTNDQSKYYTGFTVQPGSIVSRPFPTIPTNTVECQIWTFPNANSPFSFADLPLRITLFGSPTVYGPFTNYPVLIPGTTGTPSLTAIYNSQSFFGFNFAISNNTPNQVIFDLRTDVITTNGSGNYFLALSNLDNSIGTPNPSSTGPGPYYRYETGTSMAAADVSGVLALMQQFYFNAYNVLPSPAMLKAMIINGGQATGLYNFLVQNTLNYEGWGLVNLPDSLPPGITNQLNTACSAYIQDQSPANALATGGSQTYQVTFATNGAPLRVTLAWTDPPGDPAAAIKLVNNLVLVVTNLSNPTNPIVYYGNDIGSSTVNNPHATNTPPVFDSINNVQNVYLQPGAGTSFTVTVLGYRVNVNAVTAQTNNVVQDYALVISTGNSGLTNVMTVNPVPASSGYNATGDQQITYPSQTSAGSGPTATSFAELLNQFVGANSPLLGTNTIVFPPGKNGFGPNNWQVTVGQTNQWQFYVVTNLNPSSLSNAAFITFNPNAPDPDTLSIPRLGVYQTSVGNATREADIDMYVTTDPSITNLNPAAISNAVVGTQIGAPPGGPFAGASLGRGTTEFVVDTNSWSRPAPNVYYVGVKSEDQQSAEYGFIAIFSAAPFSTMNNGVQTVYGVPVPMNIPDGSPTVPGKGYVFGLAIYPETVGTVTVANSITHQNFGDLIGTLTLNGAHADVLNNHDSLGGPPGPYFLTYDDSAGGGIPGSRPSDGPGSLIGYFGQQGLGVWMLNEVDDSLTQTGAVNGFTTTIYPHLDPTVGVITNYVPGGSWVYTFVDVPPGATDLTVYATNLTDTATPPVELFVKFGSEPTTNNYDAVVPLTPNGVISLGPPLVSGRYFIGLFNPNPKSAVQEVTLFATIDLPFVPAQTIYSSTDTPIPILDDAVTTDQINVPDNQIISSMDVAIAVQHPRISDLVFHLISPDGTRELLMENRGGTDPNGAGGVATVTTNNALASDFDTVAPGDYAAGQPVGGWIVAGNQVSVQTDPVNAYTGNSNLLALANGTLYTTLATVPGATYTLTFQYRGPDIVSMWRGENNPLDSAGGGNDGTWNGTGAYGLGEVGSAFSFNGANNDVGILNAPSLNPTGAFSIEGWIYPLVDKEAKILVKWGDQGAYSNERSYSFQTDVGKGLGFSISDLANQGNAVFQAFVVANVLTLNQWNHVAATYDSATGARRLYVNGAPVGVHINAPVSVYTSTTPVTIGAWLRAPGVTQDYFDGSIDELGFYGRSLSASEIQAIYADGTNGDFNPNRSIPGALAEAQVSINGVTTNTFFGNNTTWQPQTITFTATSGTTALQIQGLEPGMLLDAASVTAVITNYNYLVFTENTNLTTTPIKFAVPPFLPNTSSTNLAASGFDSATPGDYTTTFNDGTNVWNVLGNQVSVVNDPANADAGNQFLALANGTVSSTLPTVAGQTYVLTFRYRGPGIVGWWRAENNTNDSSGFGNNAVSAPNITYQAGKVGQAFNFNGSSSSVTIGPSASLAVSNLTFEGWIYPTTSQYEPIIDYGGPGQGSAAHLWINGSGLSTIPGAIYANLRPNANVAITSSGGIVPANAWSHIAFTYNLATATEYLYYNGGQVQVNVATPDIPPSIGEPVNLGWRNNAEALNGTRYAGLMDEISIYNRALSASEIKAIYQNGSAGKFDSGEPNPQSLAEAQVSINGGTPTTLLGNDSAWQTKTIVFTATQNATPLQIASVEPGMLLDSFSLSPSVNNLYYLPEQSLDTYDRLNAQGNWTLEIQDDRVGATNPIPELLSWQLRFNYVTFGTNANAIPPGTTATNVIPAGGWTNYLINVPANADVATNILVFATGPLNVWFNSATPPPPGNNLLLSGVINGTSVLSTFSVPTNIVPGGIYYIGLQNPNAFPVTSGFQVNFHYFQTTPVTPGVPVTNTVAGAISGDGVDYYSVKVPPDADYATNLLLSSTVPVNMWFNQSRPPVCLTPPDYLLIANALSGTNVLSTNSVPPLLPGLTYYLAVQNTNAGNATYALVVNFHHIASSLTNGVPTTNSVPTNSFVYYSVTLPTNADYATNLLLFASLPVNVWFNQTGLPTGTNPPDYLLIPNATSGISILSAGSTPPLVPGATYYLGVQNTNNVPVNFGLEVDFHLVIPIPITGPTLTQTNVNGTNGFLLQWTGPTNDQYTIQWKTNLAPVIPWNTVSNPVINVTYTPTNGDYSWFDDGSLTGGWPPEKFYRVVANLLSGPITNSTPVTNIVVSGTITPLTVTVPTNAIAATNVLVSASGPVDVWFNQNTQPTGNTGAGDVLMISTNTSGTFVLTGSSVPPLVPGANYYLGIQSLGTSNVLFSFQVNFAYGSPPTNPPSISSITVTNVGGTNEILLQWTEPTNYQFQVEWATNLAPAIAWHTISNVVLKWPVALSPTNAAYGLFQFLDDGSLTGGWGPLKFYRLVEYPYSTPIPQSLTIVNTAMIGNAVLFQWVAPTNYQYSVLWTTNLGLPLSNWFVLSNPVLGLSNGVYTFTDTNQTGPATSPKFFRLLEH